MFFIIPVGRDAPVKKIPKVTLTLIALNVLIFLITVTIIGKQSKQIIKLETEKIETETQLIIIENQHRQSDFSIDVIEDMARQVDRDKRKKLFVPYLALSGELKEKLQEIREKFKNGEIVDKDTPEYEQWFALYERLPLLERELAEAKESFIFNKYGFIPKEFSFETMFTSMFLHTGFLHLIGNMLFLWLVGCCIEDRWGTGTFIIFYLLGGIAAMLMHKYMYPSSEVPCIGASGAVAGVMGAFMIRYFKTKVEFFYFLLLFFKPYFGKFKMYAGVVLPLWFGQQLFMGLLTTKQTGGVAFWAHIGGFIFGAAVGSILKFGKIENKYIKPKMDEQEKEIYGHPKVLQAQELYEIGDTDNAIVLFKEAINEEPYNLDAHQGLAKIYKYRNLTNNMIYEFNRIIEIHIKKNQRVDALLKYTEFIESFPKEIILEPLNQYYIAKFMQENGDFQRALSIYKNFIFIYPDNNLVWRVLLECGNIYLEDLKQPQEALNFFEKSLAKNPPFEWADIIREKIDQTTK